MGKIFAISNEAYASMTHGFSCHMDELCEASIAAAFQGDYALSMSLYLKRFRAMPRVRAGKKSHEALLDELRHAMADSFERSFAKTARSLHEEVLVLIQEDVRDCVPEELVSETLMLHVREFEAHANMASALGAVSMIVNHMLAEGVGISEGNLRGIHALVSAPEEKT